MHVRKINPQDKRDLKQWTHFPFELYKKCDLWVPPLIRSEEKKLDRDRHPFYHHSTAEFYLAEEGHTAMGRIALIHNRRYIEHCGQNTGFFGFFEVVEDVEVARALFNTLFDWARKKGFDSVRGPVGLIGSESSGVLVEGFEHRPALNVPYNYPYYDEFIKDSGFVKHRDSLSSYLSASAEVPERVLRIAEIVKKRRGFWIRAFDTKDELRAMADQVTNVHREAFSTGFEHYPHTDAEYELVAGDLIDICDPRLIKLVMKDDSVIGFVFAYPDVGDGLKRAKGKLFPFGWYHIMRDKSRTKWVNVNGLGILPEYQGLGANAVLYAELAKTIKSFDFEHADTVFVGEENFMSFSDHLSLGVDFYKRHRLYRRDL